MHIVAQTSLALLLAASSAAQSTSQQSQQSQQWPQFRGFRARGIADGHETPAKWSLRPRARNASETRDQASGDRNIAWRTPIPGLAHSSPVVWGDKLFLTTAVQQDGEAKLESLYGSKGYGAGESAEGGVAQTFAVYCLHPRTGAILWRRVAHTGVPKVQRHPKSSHANPTPACDAKRVVVSFGSEGLYCYDHDGALLWKRDLGVLDAAAPGYGKQGYQWGFASSPVLHEGQVFVQCDHEGQSFVAALDAADGADLWRIERAENSTWCTPTVHDVAAGDRAQLIVNGYKHIGGYDLETGAVIWRTSGGGDVPVPSPVVAHGLIYLTSAHGRSRPIRAVRVNAEGPVGDDPEQEKHLAWHLARQGIYMQTPLCYRGLLYCCSDGGILSCYDAETGKRVYRARLGGGTTGFSGSPVAADGKIYFSGESGEVFVVKAGAEFDLLATNDFDETLMATPAMARGTLFFRTRRNVVGVRSPAK